MGRQPEPGNRRARLLSSEVARNFPITLLAGLLAGLLASGCATLKDPEASQEYNADTILTVNPGQSVGQSFVSRRPALDGVLLWLLPVEDSPATGVLTATLYGASGDIHNAQPLGVITSTYGTGARPYPLSLAFPDETVSRTASDPPNQAYYLEVRSDLALRVFGRAEDAYPLGRLYLERNPYQADAAFRTSYEYGPQAILGDLAIVISYLWLALPLLAALWLPGALVLEFSGWDLLDRGERMALSIGLSLALVPLILLWTSLVGLHWSPGGAQGFLAAMAVLYASLRLRHYRSERHFTSPQSRTPEPSGLASLSLSPIPHQTEAELPLPPTPSLQGGGQGVGPRRAEALLLVVFLFSFGVRLAMVRDLAAPAWVDSVHHALFARLIAESGGYPLSYAPYLEINTAQYHSGFHASVALFHWLSGLPIPEALLLFGQVLNALCVLSVYLFTTTLARDRLAGLLAALATGTLSLMPAYYTGWGRYTQLAGLVILPAALYLVLRLVAQPRPLRLSWPIWLLAGIACAGLFLVHYRILVFFALLLAAWGIAEIVRSLNKQALWVSLPRLALPVAATALLAILLTLPWWPAFLHTMVVPLASDGPAQAQTLHINQGYLEPVYGRQLMLLAGIGLAWTILRKHWFGPTLALWVGLLFLAANPGNLGLPGGPYVNNTSVEIMLFLPISVLAAYPVAGATRWIERQFSSRLRLLPQAGLVVAAAALAVAGAIRLLPVLNPVTLLARAADQPAWEWAAANLPASEQTLTNPFLWGYGLYAGQDGGYWLAPAAGRVSMPPPVLYALGDLQAVNQLLEQALQSAKDPASLHALLEQNDIHYIFLGARGGVFSPKLLRESGLFKTLYNQDGVWIFELVE